MILDTNKIKSFAARSVNATNILLIIDYEGKTGAVFCASPGTGLPLAALTGKELPVSSEGPASADRKTADLRSTDLTLLFSGRLISDQLTLSRLSPSVNCINLWVRD
jgi:hypothetical protein